MCISALEKAFKNKRIRAPYSLIVAIWLVSWYLISCADPILQPGNTTTGNNIAHIEKVGKKEKKESKQVATRQQVVDQPSLTYQEEKITTQDPNNNNSPNWAGTSKTHADNPTTSLTKSQGKAKSLGSKKLPTHPIYPTPTIKHLTLSSTLAEEKVENLIKEGIGLKISALRSPEDMQGAITKLQQAAESEYGVIQAAYLLGRIGEGLNDTESAIRWYIISFQHNWLQDPKEAYQSNAYLRLNQLAEQGNEIAQRVLLIHPAVNNPIGQYERVRNLIELYQNQTAEPYLNEEERKAKIARLKESLDGYLFNNPDAFGLWKKGKENYVNALELLGESKYEEAKKLLLQITFLPDACYELGNLYKKGYIGSGLPDYRQAADLWAKANTPLAFYKLGKLYKKGRIGKTDEKINYKKAKAYLVLAGTGKAHFHLGDLYLKKHIQLEDTQVNDEKAKEHFEQSTKKGCMLAWTSLAYLCLEEHTDQLNNQPNYELAIIYLQKFTSKAQPLRKKDQALRSESLHNLGLIYLEGHVGLKKDKPDYQKAQRYFEQANISPSFYLLGSLYEEGHIGSTYSQKDKKQVSNYQQALNYYVKSGTPEAKLAILRLYQLGCMKPPDPEEQQQIVKRTIHEIKDVLPQLTLDNYYYTRGMVAYYTGAWEDALINLQQALVFLGQDAFFTEKEIKKVIESLSSYLLSLLVVSFENQAIELGKRAMECMQGLAGQQVKYQQEKIGSIIADADLIIQNGELVINLLNINRPNSPKDTGKQQEANQAEEQPWQDALTKPAEEQLKEKEEVKDGAPLIKQEVICEKTSLQEETSTIHGLEEDQQLSLQPVVSVAVLTEPQVQLIKQQKSSSLTRHHLKAAPIPSLPTIEFIFLDENQQEAFETFKKENKKIHELLVDIQSNPWNANGVGKPEILKYVYQGYKGCLSRRIDQESRLVYKASGKGKILILSWKGHYGK